ncbi:MAG: hypothetical protein FJ202_00435 [Gemmatimonadetes bacterium]|nr:hypothetical protein [Gemmatimonadota bacterium]
MLDRADEIIAVMLFAAFFFRDAAYIPGWLPDTLIVCAAVLALASGVAKRRRNAKVRGVPPTTP